ncbi:MAG: hypothetical protein EPN48_13740 [Microbacteriaceae bacterium]|nr:MAG: hypothetical protein EPN48_13740 [Microbacteriaceae bacterium]
MVAIQIRDVPEQVRRALADEAETRGQSLQAYLLAVLERESSNARNGAFLRRYRGPRSDGRSATVDATAAIRSERERDAPGKDHSSSAASLRDRR